MQKRVLKKYLEGDTRIEKLFRLAKGVYDSKNLPNHNINHIAQVLYRALLIAENDQLKFNPSILIPACILHDIGYSIIPKKEGHEEAGVEVSRKLLKEANFSEDEINKIIQAFVEYRVVGVSVESDILYDADVLNQAGYGSMASFFYSLYEYTQFPDGKSEKYKLDTFLKSRIEIVEKLKKNGLRTKYGNDLLKNGFTERREFVEKALQGVVERPDFMISPEDLF